MMMTAIVFFALAFMAFLGALTLVFHKHPVVATLGMAVATLSVGALYIVLHVPFLGLFQMIVYAGAVMVIVLYIIMSLGHEETGAQVSMTQSLLTYLASMLLLWHLYRVVLKAEAGVMPDVQRAYGSIQAFGNLLVEHYAVPFEVASLLLLGAMVGAVILSRRQWT
jgi:NADH-quinone oxidoreductase subunit J